MVVYQTRPFPWGLHLQTTVCETMTRSDADHQPQQTAVRLCNNFISIVLCSQWNFTYIPNSIYINIFIGFDLIQIAVGMRNPLIIHKAPISSERTQTAQPHNCVQHARKWRTKNQNEFYHAGPQQWATGSLATNPDPQALNMASISQGKSTPLCSVCRKYLPAFRF